MDKTSKNHYILVVHGTWNAPEPGKLKWYQLRTRDFEHSSERLKDTKDFKNFCEHLNEHFAETPMRSAVWKSANDIQSQFSWSGDNDHTKRIEAAEELAADILRISRADPLACIHLIGHSHGGNVILKAVDNYVATFQRDAKQLAEHFFEVYKKPEDLEKKANLVIDKVFAGQVSLFF